MRGLVRTPEHCRHLSDSLKGRIAPMKGRHLSEATKRIRSDMRKGCTLSNDHKAHITIGVKCAIENGKKNYGHPMSDENKKAISLLHKGNTYTRGHSLSLEHRAKISRSLIGNQRALGNVLSPEMRERVVVGAAKWIAHWPKKPTNLEIALYKLLDMAAYRYERQKRFGRYVVDAYVPEINVAFEADGSFWHQDKLRERIRDKRLCESVKTVIHLGERDLLPIIQALP